MAFSSIPLWTSIVVGIVVHALDRWPLGIAVQAAPGGLFSLMLVLETTTHKWEVFDHEAG
jgi:hypothetical protein